MMENQENKNEIKYPEELEKLYKEALDAFEEGNYTKAKLKFEEAIKYHEKHNIPYNIDALKILSHIYLLLNENTKAKLLISRLMKEDNSPVQAFKMAVAFAQSGDYATAKNILEDVLKKVKEDESIENKNEILASILNLLGNINFELGDLFLAKENFEEALKYKPKANTIEANLEYIKNLLPDSNKENKD